MTIRVVGVFGTEGGVCFSTMGFDRGLNEIGQNTGNAMFQRAVWERITVPKVRITLQNWHEYVGVIDLLVIPAANQVNPQWDLVYWAKMVEGLNVPVCVVGLGAQADIDAKADLQLPAGTMRFLKLLSERTSHIGVRGAFTQEVLARVGVKNTIVTGCPSNFMNRALTGESIQKCLDSARDRQTHRMGYVFGTMEEVTRDTERVLWAIAAKNNAQIVYQTNPVTLRFIHDGTITKEGDASLKWEAGVLGGKELTLDDYKGIITRRGVFFSDARSWIDMMHPMDVVIGMRIHGAIAAIQAGTLGVCVAFDSRTLELVQTMQYPMVRTSDIKPGDDLPAILKKVRFDPKAFDAARVTLGKAIDGIFAKAELAV